MVADNRKRLVFQIFGVFSQVRAFEYLVDTFTVSQTPAAPLPISPRDLLRTRVNQIGRRPDDEEGCTR